MQIARKLAEKKIEQDDKTKTVLAFNSDCDVFKAAKLTKDPETEYIVIDLGAD